jgi:hypothetical protein
MYNPIDSCYKKAIEQYGVIATIDENQTKILIRDANNNTYGIDYKKIISSTSIQQGNYVFINGVQYLIIDTEEQLSQSIYNVGIFRKTLSILLGSNYKPVQSVVDKYRGQYVDGQYINEVHDQYTFIIPKLGNTSVVGGTLVYDLGVYDILSIDSSKDGIFIITGKYNTVYVPHTYTITLADTTKTLQETETYQIVTTCSDNGTTVTNPTITYHSSNTDIATVDSTGVVNCVGVGNATITCLYNNVSTDLAITVEAKPAEPVISYTYAFSQSITQLKEYMTTTLTTGKTVNGVADSTLKINYVFDSVGQSLISSGKVVITVASDSSIKIKNASVTSNTVIHLTVTDSANGTVIVDTDITLTGM